MTVVYTAIGTVEKSNVYFSPVEVKAETYRELEAKMAEVARNVHYATDTENSADGYDFKDASKEPYVKHLVMPRIEWDIQREVSNV